MRTKSLWFLWFFLLSFELNAEVPTLMLRTSKGEDLSQSAEIQKRTPVFIYYVADVRPAFDSPFQDHLQKILAALVAPENEGTSEERAFLLKVRKFILTDLELARSHADREIVPLTSEVCTPNSLYPFNLVIFRNSTVPAVKVGDGQYSSVLTSYDICRPAAVVGGASERKVWEIPGLGGDFATPQWRDQFLSHPAVFRRAMQEVENQFPHDRYRYILMIRSRGDAEHISKAQYAFDASALDAVKLRDAFRSRMADFGGTSFKPELALSLRVQDVLASVLPPFGKLSAGMTKWELLEALAELGGGDPLQGMFFSQVILNTLGGPLEQSLKLKSFTIANDYTGLNIRNIGGIRHFGETGSEEPAPFDKIHGSLAAPYPTLEARWNQLLDREAQKGLKP